MAKVTAYQKPELVEYSRFGIVAEGNSGGQGEERTDTDKCNIPGLDELA